MNIKTFAWATTLSLVLSGCVKNYAALPVSGADQQVRYTQGVATTFSDKAEGSVQVTPLGYNPETNRLVFGAAAFNKGKTPANFSLSELSISSAGTGLRTYTRDELAREARVKAAWQAAAVILAGAAAAYSANQNAYNTTNGYISGPAGITTFSATSYNPGVAAAGTAVAVAGTGYGLATINNSLDNTISSLNGSILQINTVDPGTSAGGQVVVDMPKAKTFPQPLEISVNWNGEMHRFSYNVVEAAQ